MKFFKKFDGESTKFSGLVANPFSLIDSAIEAAKPDRHVILFARDDPDEKGEVARRIQRERNDLFFQKGFFGTPAKETTLLIFSSDLKKYDLEQRRQIQYLADYGPAQKIRIAFIDEMQKGICLI